MPTNNHRTNLQPPKNLILIHQTPPRTPTTPPWTIMKLIPDWQMSPPIPEAQALTAHVILKTTIPSRIPLLQTITITTTKNLHTHNTIRNKTNSYPLPMSEGSWRRWVACFVALPLPPSTSPMFDLLLCTYRWFQGMERYQKTQKKRCKNVCLSS